MTEYETIRDKVLECLAECKGDQRRFNKVGMHIECSCYHATSKEDKICYIQGILENDIEKLYDGREHLMTFPQIKDYI